MSAVLFGTVGTLWIFAAGIGLWDWSIGKAAWVVAASVIAGFVALVGTLQAERTRWVRKRFLNRQAKTWGFFVTSYFGGMFLLSADVRPWVNPIPFAVLVIPLMCVNGWTILAFGPLQDRRVAREQRREREKLAATRTDVMV